MRIQRATRSGAMAASLAGVSAVGSDAPTVAMIGDAVREDPATMLVAGRACATLGSWLAVHEGFGNLKPLLFPNLRRSAVALLPVVVGLLALDAPERTLVVLSAVAAVAALWLVEASRPGVLMLSMVAAYTVKARDAAAFPQDLSGVPVSTTELVLGVSLLVWLVRRSRQGKPGVLPPGPGMGTLVLYELVWPMVFALGVGGDLLFSLRYSILFAYALFYPLAVDALQTRSAARWSLRVLVAGGAVLAIGSAVQAVGVPVPVVGPGGNSHFFLGTSLIAMTVLAVGRGRGWLVPLGLVGLLCFEVLISEVRGMWLALAGTAALAGVLVVGHAGLSRQLRHVNRLAFGGVIGAIVVVVALGPSKLADLADKGTTIVAFEGRGDYKSAESAQRLAIWGDIVRKVSEEPLFGIGLGTPFDYPSIDDPAEVFGYGLGLGNPGFNPPHNSYMLLLLRTGIVGLGLFLAFFLRWLTSSVPRLYRAGDPEMRAYALISLLCTVYLLLVALTEPVFEGPYIGQFVWIFAGATVALLRLAERPETA